VLELSLYRVCWNCHFTGCVGTVIIPLLPKVGLGWVESDTKFA